MKLQHISLTIIITLLSSFNEASARDNRYEVLKSLSGKLESEMQVQIHKKSKTLDLAKSSNIRLRLRPEDLYKSKNISSSFKVNAYEFKNGKREFISSQAVTLLKSKSKSKIISVDLGYFDSMKKDIELDIFDTNNNHAATYAVQVNAHNQSQQIKHKQELSLADCDNSQFGQCQVDYLLSNLSFELKPIKSMSTRIVKADDGHYKVIIPMQKSYTRKPRFRNRIKKHAISKDKTRSKRHFRKTARALPSTEITRS